MLALISPPAQRRGAPPRAAPAVNTPPPSIHAYATLRPAWARTRVPPATPSVRLRIVPSGNTAWPAQNALAKTPASHGPHGSRALRFRNDDSASAATRHSSTRASWAFVRAASPDDTHALQQPHRRWLRS